MTSPTLREPQCHICGRSRTRCLEQRVFEETRAMPDPHDFETLADAERRRAARRPA